MRNCEDTKRNKLTFFIIYNNETWVNCEVLNLRLYENKKTKDKSKTYKLRFTT